ncbi:MAG: hypothetical protein OQJ99_01305 [Rhodospirillales bacterium]|nr:hypothetical protein [Rhodospirillales bacterium]MCW8860900.1 hypothetical protein [Rhodospirillales bacterium]MCW8952458.1 hypothetical protein [Rhodospirillales bacterium]MCW8970907.1 hypothetical protein [Rhodospirillales bacterium]MCW9003400.1 hypothetical protein [Rhodospirillales bacterium]
MTDHSKYELPGRMPRQAAMPAAVHVAPISKETVVTPKGLTRTEAREIVLAILG